MSEYIITDEWMREYERSVEDLIGFDIEYDSATNPVPPISARNIIVRCRDCRYYTHNAFPRCDLYSVSHEVEPDGFCAWGLRRNDTENGMEVQ